MESKQLELNDKKKKIKTYLGMPTKKGKMIQEKV